MGQKTTEKKTKTVNAECTLTPREAEALMKAMGAATVEEAARKAVEIATRTPEPKKKAGK